MPITLVQKIQANAAAATVTATLGSNTTAGNCLVVCIGMAGTTATISSVQLGGVADHFSSLINVNESATVPGCAIWADPNCAGGQTAVKVTMSAATDVAVDVYEVSGLATSSVLDKSSSNTATSASWTSGTTATTTQGAEFWAGIVMASGGAGTVTGPGAPWTNEPTQTTPDADLEKSGHQITSSTGTATYSGTFTSSVAYAAAVVTLLPPAAAPAGTVQPLATVPIRRRKPSRAVTPPAPIIGGPPAPRGKTQPRATVPIPRRRLARAVVPPAPIIGPPPEPRGTVQPLATVPIRRRKPSRAVTPPKPVIGLPPVPVGPPPAIPTSGGDRGITIRVFREIKPGDVPAAGAQLPKLTGRAFAMPIPADEEHAIHAWEILEEPGPPPGPSALEQARAHLEVAGSRALEVGRIFADPPYERHPKTCGAIRKIGGVMLTCGRKPGHQGKHSDRGLDWR